MIVASPFASDAAALPGDGTARHPRGSKTRVLLTSVFGPYAQDDEYGSRAMNPMELYHNQVTRVQGPFSLRMFHRSWGIMLIQNNIDAPCTLLDFPTLDRFIEEIRDNDYDVVGITSIPLNVMKVKKMCELVREHLPHATIVIGGHIANVPGIDRTIDADHIVRGDGVRWFRDYLGQDPSQPIRHPEITSGFGTRALGVAQREPKGSVAATVIPSVGCPLGCNFCATSAMFGGKGKFIDFYQSGDELFDVMCQLERSMKVQSYFLMDENFLLHRPRAMRLLELIRQHDKAWKLYVFSSANAIRKYEIEDLVDMGISWVWMGLEGEESQYVKLKGVDSRELVATLQSHGIHVLGSTIIGMENHCADNIDAAIKYAVQHDTDFHQFMLYTPVAGTPLHAELTADGRMKDESEFHPGDIHGQLMFNYRHPLIRNGEESEFILRAFQQDFEVNGPSVLRIVRTELAGCQRYRKHPRSGVRRRFARDAAELATTYSAVTWAARQYYRSIRPRPHLESRFTTLLAELAGAFGIKSRLAALFGGPYVYAKLRAEEKRLSAGWTYEPATFYEKNFVEAHPAHAKHPATLCTCVIPQAIHAEIA